MEQSKDAHLKTIITITVGFTILYVVLHKVIFLYFTITIGLLSLISERLAIFIHKAWMQLAKLMSYVVPNIVMGIVFYFILTPIALLQRLIKKNKAFLKAAPAKTTFIQLNKTFTKERFEKPW